MCYSVLIAQSCQTLCDPIDCCPPGFSVHGILQARRLECVAISFSRESSLPRDQTLVSCISSRFFTIWAIYASPEQGIKGFFSGGNFSAHNEIFNRAFWVHLIKPAAVSPSDLLQEWQRLVRKWCSCVRLSVSFKCLTVKGKQTAKGHKSFAGSLLTQKRPSRNKQVKN